MADRTTSAVRLTMLTVAIGLLFALVVPAYAMSAATEASTSLRLVNAARTDTGRSALPSDARLERIARDHSARMAAQGSISHSEHLGRDATSAGIDWGWLGENVGVGPDAKVIHDGFMQSPHHREIVVSRDANAVGVGVVIGRDGRVYLTQVYAKLRNANRPVRVAAQMRTVIPDVPAAGSPPPAATHEPTPDPNAITGGVVRHDVFRAVTRSGLRAS